MGSRLVMPISVIFRPFYQSSKPICLPSLPSFMYIEYEGFVELNFQVPGRNFSEDHLFLVVPPIKYHEEVPAIVGTYVLDRYV